MPLTGEPLVKVYDNERLVFSTPVASGLVIGRQSQGEPPPFCRIDGRDGTTRVIVAPLQETTVSRIHARLERVSGELRLTNESTSRPINMASGPPLPPGGQCNLPMPSLLMIGSKVLRVEMPESATAVGEPELRTLPRATWAPGQQWHTPPSEIDLADPDGTKLEALMKWLQSALVVFQSAATTPDFFARAAQSTLDLVRLDSAAVLLYRGGRWELQSRARTGGLGDWSDEWQPSQTILERVRTGCRTFRQMPGGDVSVIHSLQGVTALVAAPILNEKSECIGVIYGDRHHARPRRNSSEITELEAVMVELLACGVAAGLARLEQEKAVVAARVQFEQFFTPQLAAELAENPDLLSGRDAEVSILFADIRGFSRISQQVGPAKTVEWIHFALSELSDCVLNHDGVLVDYVGDELMAMFGAPSICPNHADQACAAALEMLRRIDCINAAWQNEIGEPMGLGIGINSGIARVGNVGSSQKFKYGALGNTVNLASRVQGATKYFKSSLLVTGSTWGHVQENFAARRVGDVRVVNIQGAVDLYELADLDHTPNFHELKRCYESALELFEDGKYLEATRKLGDLLARHEYDGPSLVLLSRATQALTGSTIDRVWDLPGK